ncbi:MAG: fasciclin domain-containing protein [Acidobacteriota bacterium]
MMKLLTATAISMTLLLGSACSSMHSGMSDSSMSTMANKTIAEVAMSTGMHNTLVAALKSAGLADMMMQSGSYTVFAPTDAAFAKLPAGTVEMLMRPENHDKLRMLLQYHVVPGRVDASHLMSMSTVKTVSGQNLSVMNMNGSVMVGSANVIKSDVMASNGVVHVIDTVLMPPGMM